MNRMATVLVLLLLVVALTVHAQNSQTAQNKKPKIYIDADNSMPSSLDLYGASIGTTPKKEITKEWLRQCFETEVVDKKQPANYIVHFTDGRVSLLDSKQKLLFQSSFPLAGRLEMNASAVRDACNAIRKVERLPLPVPLGIYVLIRDYPAADSIDSFSIMTHCIDRSDSECLKAMLRDGKIFFLTEGTYIRGEEVAYGIFLGTVTSGENASRSAYLSPKVIR